MQCWYLWYRVRGHGVGCDAYSSSISCCIGLSLCLCMPASVVFPTVQRQDFKDFLSYERALHSVGDPFWFVIAVPVTAVQGRTSWLHHPLSVARENRSCRRNQRISEQPRTPSPTLPAPHPPSPTLSPTIPQIRRYLFRPCRTLFFFLQRIADRIHASGWTRGIGVEGVEDLAEEGEVVGDEGIVDEHDSAWLLEQNAWLMEELDSKDGEWFVTVGTCGVWGGGVGAGAGLRGYCLRPRWREAG